MGVQPGGLATSIVRKVAQGRDWLAVSQPLQLPPLSLVLVLLLSISLGLCIILPWNCHPPATHLISPLSQTQCRT